MTKLANVLVFYAMALGASLALALLATPVIGEYATLVVMMTPLLSVLVMKLIFNREGYTRSGWSDLGLARLGLRLWPVAFGMPFGVLLVAYGVVWLFGVAQFGVPGNPSDIALNAALNFGVGLVVCLGEEAGWRGYLLPRLLPLGQRTALLLSGLMQAVWHLPFIVFTTVYHGDGNQWIIVPLFLATMTIAGILFGYLRLASKSTWPAVIAHSVFNTYWTLFGAFTVAASPLAFEYLAGESGVITLVAVAFSAWVLIRRLERPQGSIPAAT
ncbi:type II CAAX prenyl endopeptidase Rce1 family protein [Devosia sp.]|uniref:CPBP family glutamic-type intramembrane protease n=1 Tax=Devosia sp. TaxID=1871048 RepID=UPI003BA8DA65